MNYTKGEWKVVNRDGLRVDDETHRTIAFIFDGSYEEREANAQLIAQAPNMYEALKAASTIIHNAIRGTEGGYRTMLQQELRRIQEALSKAEGK